MKAIISKIENGDGLTDEELNASIEFFADLVNKLEILGEKYFLARSVALRDLQALEMYQRARSIKG